MLLISIFSAICLLLCCGLLMFTIYMRMRIQQMIQDYEDQALLDSKEATEHLAYFISLLEQENVHKNKTLSKKRKGEGSVGR